MLKDIPLYNAWQCHSDFIYSTSWVCSGLGNFENVLWELHNTSLCLVLPVSTWSQLRRLNQGYGSQFPICVSWGLNLRMLSMWLRSCTHWSFLQWSSQDWFVVTLVGMAVVLSNEIQIGALIQAGAFPLTAAGTESVEVAQPSWICSLFSTVFRLSGHNRLLSWNDIRCLLFLYIPFEMKETKFPEMGQNDSQKFVSMAPWVIGDLVKQWTSAM